jgi:transposase InsO family protein
VWQLTACDCASPFGWARIVVGEVTAAIMAAFLTEAVRPGYDAAGWRLRRVLTDNGKEFKARFVTTCATARVVHTRTKPRHAWTNGIVERLQGTILHEHWRVEFRRYYFTSARGLQRSLDRFLRFYNGQRPIVATDCEAARRRRSSRAPWPLERARRPHLLGSARAANAWKKLSTPLRYWTH